MDLSSGLARALRDPALAQFLGNVAEKLLRAQKTHERIQWGHAADGEPVLDEIGIADDPETVVPLGALVSVEYLSRKGDDGISVYHHVFDTPRPILVMTEDQQLAIARGRSRYTVRTAGITG